MRVKFCFLIVAVLAGCTTSTGPKYSEVASAIPSPAPGKSRLIIFRKWNYYAGGLDARVRIDGRKNLSLSTNTFSYIDVTPKTTEISVDAWGTIGTFIISVNLKAGREHYLMIGSGVSMGMLIGTGIITKGVVTADDVAVKEAEAAVIEDSGALMIVPVTKEEALKLLPAMRLAQPDLTVLQPTFPR